MLSLGGAFGSIGGVLFSGNNDNRNSGTGHFGAWHRPVSVNAGVAAVTLVEANISIEVRNGERYTRLLRIRSEWDGSPEDIPYLSLHDDNFFDMLPGETRVINAKLLFNRAKPAHLSGKLIVSGTNVEPFSSPISFSSAFTKTPATSLPRHPQ